jgi:WD40 repeat protein
VATGDRSGMVSIWNLDDTQTDSNGREPRKRFSRASHHGRVESLIFTRDERQLVSVGDDGCLSRTAPQEVQAVRLLSVPGWRDVFSGFRLADKGLAVLWSDEDPAQPTYLAALRQDASMHAWTLRRGDDVIHLRHRGREREDAPLKVDLPAGVSIDWFDFVPNTPLLLVRTHGGDHDLRFYDLVGRRWVLESFNPQADLVALSHDGKRVAYERQKVVTVVDFPGLDHCVELRRHPESVETIALNQDGSILVTGSGDRSIRIWNTETGTVLHVLKDHLAPVLAVAISADSKTLASGDATGRMKLWHLPSGKPFFDLPRMGEQCRELALSTDGSRLICRCPNYRLFEFLTRSEPSERDVSNYQVFPEY